MSQGSRAAINYDIICALIWYIPTKKTVDIVIEIETIKLH